MSKPDVLFLFLSFPLLYASSILCLLYEARNPEVEALIHIRGELNDPGGALNNWDEDSADPCSWSMVTCSSRNLVTALEAPSQGLSGTLSRVIANLTNLRQLLLQNNNISGRIPSELGLLPNLETLDLSNNKLSGPLPDPLTSHHFPALRYLRLNNNSLSGAIPSSLASIPQLALLDLSYNNLSEPVPKFTARTFNILGNPLICHEGSCGSGSGIPHPLSLAVNPSPGHSNSRRVAIAFGVGISCLFLILLSLWFFFYRRRKKPKQSILGINEINDMAEEMMSLGNLRNFTLKELQQATGNFSSRNILGAGGFGNVYKGKLGDGTMVAVKRLKDVSHGSSGAGESQFRMELELISLAVHRNLLRLLGYCATQAERLLVYPYMSNGSVAYRLRGGKLALVLDWGARKRIAIGAARGLVYLHEQCDPKIIHRDVKAANVLLDEYDEAVVGDFGLAKLLDHADSHVTTAVRGTVGHIAPEYLSTGQSSDKTDVFGFGILLLELVTGMTPLQLMAKTSTTPLAHNDHQAGKTRGVVLLEWVKRVVEEKNVQVLIDPQLGSDYDKVEAGEMLQVALHCTQYLPARRPKMSQVLLMLEGEGLALKWEASLVNHSNNNNPNPTSTSTSTTRSLMQMNSSSPSNNVIVNNNRVDQSKDHHNYSTMSGMMLMEDYDTTPAMELSGPR